MIITPSAPSMDSSSTRLMRGTKAMQDYPPQSSDQPNTPSHIDGPFHLAEFLAARVRSDPHDLDGICEVPRSGQADRDVWIYEHLRRLPVDLAPLVSQLLSVCNRETCPVMKADEWLYLCVAHGGSGTEECCAIDYILHTLDSTTTLLNSTKSFPSRMSIPPSSLTNFPSLSRRLSRIFSHAYFHHRDVFLAFEAETSLYNRFVWLCAMYGLVGPNLLIIPRDEIRSLSGPGRKRRNDAEEDEEQVGAHNEVGSASGNGNGNGNANTSPDRNADVAAAAADADASSEEANAEGADWSKSDSDSSDDDDAADAESDAFARGREKDNDPRRAKSLDRGKEREVDPDLRQRGAGSGAGGNTTGDDHSRVTGSTGEANVPQKIILSRKKGTLARGKQARGTMLWASGADSSTPGQGKLGGTDGDAGEGAVGDTEDTEGTSESGGVEWDSTIKVGNNSTSPIKDNVNTIASANTSANTNTSPSKDTIKPNPNQSPTRQIITPAPPSPSAEKVSYTAATSPLNPPRSLSRSPESGRGKAGGAGAGAAGGGVGQEKDQSPIKSDK